MEDTLPVFRSNPWPIVLNGEDHAVVRLTHSETDHTIRRIKLDGVINQICPYMDQQVFISGVLNLVQFHIKINIFFSPFLLQCQNCLPYLFIKTEGSALRFDRLRIDFGQKQNIAGQGGQTARIKQNFFDVFVLLLLRLLMVLKEGGISFNGVDRCFKLMRNIGNEIRLQCLSSAQFFDHQIEVVIDIGDLFQLAGTCHRYLKIAAGHFFHGVTQLCDGIDERMRNVIGDGAAEDHTEQNRPDIDGDIHGNPQIPLKKPSCQFRQ